MVGPLILGNQAEVDGLATDLQRREIADVGEAAGVFLGEGRELLAGDERSGLASPCVGKDEYISSNTQSWITAVTLPSGAKAIWLFTVIQTCGCAPAGAATSPRWPSYDSGQRGTRS
jgi:hypothetical protein